MERSESFVSVMKDEEEEEEEEEKWRGTQYMNKVWLALQTVLEEIEKGPDGAEWIL